MAVNTDMSNISIKTALPYLFIFLCVILVSTIGGYVTSNNLDWYETLMLPDFTPTGRIIGIVWSAIYLMSAIAACLLYPLRNRFPVWLPIVWILVLNAVLNVLWTIIFFGWHQLGLAVFEMVLLNIINLLIIIVSWPIKRIASILFIPYFLWVCFATYSAYRIYILNS